METNIALANKDQLRRQKNLFLCLTIGSCLSVLILSVKLISINEKTILVPGLTQEVWVDKNGVSKGYLEETTLMYLPLLLDLNTDIIAYKESIIFKYISQSDPVYMKKFQDYFASAKERYKKFGFFTYFSVKNLEINTQALSVIANGMLTSRFGDRGFDSIPVSYLIKYERVGGHLRLKEFLQIPNAQERAMDPAKEPFKNDNTEKIEENLDENNNEIQQIEFEEGFNE